jgi:hypothetical protein
VARRKDANPFPPPLNEFREEDWPPVEGECLGHYACRGLGYGVECVPRLGEYCGQLHYEMLTRDHPDDPGMLARAKRADAWTRFRQAQLAHLGEDHPLYFDLFIDTFHAYEEIRYGERPGQ